VRTADLGGTSSTMDVGEAIAAQVGGWAGPRPIH
jgi:isocitrate/isopropylmalate dehydrogenase